MEIKSTKNKSGIIMSGMALAAFGSQLMMGTVAHADNVNTHQVATNKSVQSSAASSAVTDKKTPTSTANKTTKVTPMNFAVIPQSDDSNSNSTPASDTPTSNASSAATSSVSTSSAPSSVVSDTATPSSAAPTSNAQSGITDNSPNTIKEGSSDNNVGQSNANTDKSDANLEYGHGIDPLTGKALKDESPAQQQKAKAYVDGLNNGTIKGKDGETNAEKKANVVSANPVKSNNGSGLAGGTNGSSPLTSTTTTTTTNTELAQTADVNKTSIGAILGMSTATTMSMLGMLGLRKRI